MPSSSSYVYWRGGKFNSASLPSLIRAEALSGLPLRIMQGGYNAGGVAASAGTHDGGGVCDVSVSGWSYSQIQTCLKWLRLCGWSAWYRTPRQGFIYHIHAVRNGDSTLAWLAKSQTFSCKAGRNGLAGNGYDDGPKVGWTTWANSKYNPSNGAVLKPVAVKYLTINGKKYRDVTAVSVNQINRCRAHFWFSRHVYIVQAWLKKLGYNPGPLDGKMRPGGQTQKAYNQFRWNHRESLGITAKKGATGPVGKASLTLLRNRADSNRKVAA